MNTLTKDRIAHAEPGPEGLRIRWADGGEQTLERFWLRDNCPCAECLHADTQERTFDILQAPDSLSVSHAELAADGGLEVVWQPGGHVSHYPAAWLRRFRQDAAAVSPGQATATWDAESLPVPPVVTYADYMGDDAALARWLRELMEKGVVLLSGAPLTEGEILKVAERVAPPRDTNFGLIFDVRSKPNPNNSAYTALGLAAHVDLPNWERPPDYQLLYCLENGAEGGDTFLVDGFRVAEALRQRAAEDFFVLSETPVDFRFHDETQDIAHLAPVIGLDASGRLRDIRFNMWIMDAVRLPEAQMAAFYKAYRHFARLLREARFEMRLRLRPGQMLTFDNRRVLHGRTAFDPNSGPRHLQGTYLDRDLVLSRLRVLDRAAGAEPTS
jgi:gamma-butyrobetaine dioxygenase